MVDDIVDIVEGQKGAPDQTLSAHVGSGASDLEDPGVPRSTAALFTAFFMRIVGVCDQEVKLVEFAADLVGRRLFSKILRMLVRKASKRWPGSHLLWVLSLLLLPQ
jgi:hypothetical protein